MDSAQLTALIDALEGRTVAVIGDVVADEFVYGRVARVSREAPVLILEYDSTEIVPGAGGNAANNVAALGGRASLVSVIGRDDAGRRMLAALHRRVKRTGVTRAAGVETVIKTRILAGGIHSAKQQVVRIDRGVARPIDARARARFEQAVLASLPGADAVLMSDYGSGLVTPALARRVSGVLRRAGASHSGAHRLALRTARIPWSDSVHAERIRGRSRPLAFGSTTTPGPSKPPDARF